jgi:hypothetical protein
LHDEIASVVYGNQDTDTGLASRYFYTFKEDSPQRTERAQREKKGKNNAEAQRQNIR